MHPVLCTISCLMYCLMTDHDVTDLEYQGTVKNTKTEYLKSRT